ncbi:MAG: excalibur calcium-binding domain-containing protein [Caldilineaceae bacterium]
MTQAEEPAQPVAVDPPPPADQVVAQPPAQADCDPNYAGACIPNVSYDLDCPEVGVKDFQVVGYDHHRFDRDKDGIACES